MYNGKQQNSDHMFIQEQGYHYSQIHKRKNLMIVGFYI